MFKACSLQSLRIAVWVSAGALSFASILPAQHYTQVNLVSNNGVPSTNHDPNLVNSWGIVRGSGTPWWVADNGADTSTLYMGDGTILPLIVAVPGSPTGAVFNSTSDFNVNGKPALFIFASEGGIISAWNPTLMTTAKMVAQGHNAVYKGLALASFRGVNYLYATDFFAGKIDIFDRNFKPVDPSTLGLSSDEVFFNAASRDLGLVPFNIQNVGGTLIVTYAKQNSAKHDDVKGPGNGLVAAFTPQGKFVRNFQRGSWLNSPWGIALAPGDFGFFSHYLLVGQFGSGEIVAFNIVTGQEKGRLLDPSGNRIKIDGLWGLGFGNGNKAGPFNTLFFAAGPNGEQNGLFGNLTALPSDPSQGSSD